MSFKSDLAVRVARAEIERDAALKRAEQAERTVQALMLRDEEAMLDTLHICGIPARSMREVFETVAEWRRAGGRLTDRRND